MYPYPYFDGSNTLYNDQVTIATEKYFPFTDCANGFYFPSTGKCYAKFESAKVNWDTASNE